MEREAETLLALPQAPEIGLGGEIAPGPASVRVGKGDATVHRDYLGDVVEDKPDAVAAFGSYECMRLAAAMGAAEIAAEAADSIKAANVFERMLAHQLAVAHKLAMEHWQGRPLVTRAQMASTTGNGSLVQSRLRPRSTRLRA